MAAGNDVYDPPDYAAAAPIDNAAMAAGMDVLGTPTANVAYSHRRGLTTATGGGMMTKSNLRSIAYFAIVGGVVVWVVAHLAPLRG